MRIRPFSTGSPAGPVHSTADPRPFTPPMLATAPPRPRDASDQLNDLGQRSPETIPCVYKDVNRSAGGGQNWRASAAEFSLDSCRLLEREVRAKYLASVTAEVLDDGVGVGGAGENKRGAVSRVDQLPDVVDEFVGDAVPTLEFGGIVGTGGCSGEADTRCSCRDRGACRGST